MKKIIFLFLFVLISLPAFGQEETLISGKIENGGYGAPVVKFSTVKNNFAVFVGGYGGWLINHSFMIGGGVYYSDYGYEMFNSGDYMEKHTSTVFVFEPGINAELNVTSFFRINAGISYRIVTGIDLYGLRNGDLGGPSGNLVFKFGKF